MKFPRYIVPLSAVGTAFGAFVLFKDQVGQTKYQGKERIPGRTVIITGATSGIGKETAKELANRGARVILACRDLGRCEEVRQEIIDTSFNRNVHCRKLDLSSLKSIRDFADAINSTEKRVDILINNAGLMRNERTLTEDGFEAHIGVNYLGPFLLTNLLLDKLKASAPSRIINVIGIGYSRTPLDFTDFNCEASYRPDTAYMRSKMAMAMFTHELSRRLEGKGVTVLGVHPGVVATNLRGSLSAGGRWVKYLYNPLLKSPLLGAQTTIYCAVEPSLAGRSGCMFAECKEVPVDPVVLNDAKVNRLWMTSERWTQLGEH